MKFVVVGDGDWSVGIASSFSVVTFETDSWEWNTDMVEHTKALLKEWDDNCTTVYTEEEYDEMIKREEEGMRK